MKYFIFTFIGDGLPIAYKLQQEGHEVIVGQVQNHEDILAHEEHENPENQLTKERRLSLYDGVIPKMPAWELVEKIKHLPTYEDCFVFFDRNYLFRFAAALSDLPIAGNFPTEEDYSLEQDRDKAKKFVSEFYPKVHVTEVHEFHNVEEAKEFLHNDGKLWVLKGRNNHARTFIPHVEDPQMAIRQIIRTLEAKKDVYEHGGFILERMILSPIELTPVKIYYDGEPIAIILNIENKPFGTANTSVQTGCAQDLIFPITFEDKIHDIAFPSVIDEMAKKHKGYFNWDASLLIDKPTGKVYFGEFCSNRPGYNEIFTSIAQCSSAHKYFSSIMQKKNPFTMGSVGTSVTIFNPETDESEGNHPPKDAPIDFNPEIEKDLWLWDTYRKDDLLVTAGDDWNLAVITGAGKSIDEAVNKMYKNVEDFSFVGAYYRPKIDYVSLSYPTSILNRLNYGLDRGLYRLPFNVKIGEIKAT